MFLGRISHPKNSSSRLNSTRFVQTLAMNSLLIKFHLVSAVFVGTCLFSGNVARSQTVVLSPDQVFAQTSPSVYKLEVKGKEGTRQGSAVVYKSHVARKIGDTAFPAFSYLVTNAHVVGNEGSVIVKNGPNSFLAKVSYADATLDLALLSVQGIALTAARIDAGYSLRVGEPTFAIGTPRGLENSLSTGVVSGLRESAGAHRIQTNAAISPGSSGGGLFNVFGGLIGITTSRVVDSEGLNFAIDSRHIVEMELVLEQAISIYGYAEFRNLDPRYL